MKTFFRPIIVLLLISWCIAAHADDAAVPFEGPPMQLLAKLMEQEAFRPLLETSLSNATFEDGGWAFENGELTAKGKGDLWTQKRYGNFILSLEFKCEAKTNSGVFLRCGDMNDWLHSAIEVQILQNNSDYDNPKHHCGGIFDCQAPRTLTVREAGEWNRYNIIAQDNRIWVFLNEELVTEINLDHWTEAHKNPDGTPNKFKNAYKDMPREGHIGFQYHGQPIAFRNLSILELD